MYYESRMFVIRMSFLNFFFGTVSETFVPVPKDGTKDSSVIESFQPIQGLYRQETEVRITSFFLLNQHQNHANRFR